MTSITTYRVRFLTQRFLLGLVPAILLAGCEAVPYQVAPQEAALLPPEVAVDYLRTLPAETSVVTRPPEAGHCEFTRQGVRVAAANPGYATRTVGELRGELQCLARDREAIEREQRRVEASQQDRPRWSATTALPSWPTSSAGSTRITPAPSAGCRPAACRRPTRRAPPPPWSASAAPSRHVSPRWRRR